MKNKSKIIHINTDASHSLWVSVENENEWTKKSNYSSHFKTWTYLKSCYHRKTILKTNQEKIVIKWWKLFLIKCTFSGFQRNFLILLILPRNTYLCSTRVIFLSQNHLLFGLHILCSHVLPCGYAYKHIMAIFHFTFILVFSLTYLHGFWIVSSDISKKYDLEFCLMIAGVLLFSYLQLSNFEYLAISISYKVLFNHFKNVPWQK